MSKLIRVIDSEGAVLNDTYTKRARQLVKNQRAVWVSDQTIRLAEYFKEEKKMDEQINVNQQEINSTNEELVLALNLANEKLTAAEAQNEILDDLVILEQAKARLQYKKGLIMQTILFILLSGMTLLVLSLPWAPYHDAAYAVASLIAIFCFLQAIRITVLWCKFFKKTTKQIRLEKIVEAINKRKENQLLAEYDKIKQAKAKQAEVQPLTPVE